jgi:hypothetical protein
MYVSFYPGTLCWLVAVAAVAWLSLATELRHRREVARLQRRLDLSEAEKALQNAYWDGAQEALDNAGILWPPDDRGVRQSRVILPAEK